MPPRSRDTEFSAFVRDHRVELLRSTCLLTAGDTHLAEDLVQIALARLYVAWPRVDPATVAGYTRRIVINAYLDETRRSRWRRERPVPEPDEVARSLPVQPWPGEDVVDGSGVRAALRALPPRMRAVIVLRHWLDLSVEETAATLGCSQGNVKSQTAKACARLRAVLAAVPTTDSLKRSLR